MNSFEAQGRYPVEAIDHTCLFGAGMTAPARPEEGILIQEPGLGSQVSSPIRVVGFADPTFEQNLVIRIITADGTSHLALSGVLFYQKEQK